MTEVTELLEEIVNAMDNYIEVSSFVNSNGQTIIYTCNTKWARIGKAISIVTQINQNGSFQKSDVKILNIGTDTQIIVSGTYNVLKAYIQSPFAISGTKISTNNEWSRADRNLSNKTPLIWLYQNYKQRIYGDEASLERTIDLNIAFLDETNPKYQKNSDHIDNVVIPMNKLLDEFVKVINKTTIYKRLKQFDIRTYSRFGVETDSGVIQNVLDADLGGLVLTITLDRFKVPCKC